MPFVCFLFVCTVVFVLGHIDFHIKICIIYDKNVDGDPFIVQDSQQQQGSFIKLSSDDCPKTYRQT